jgi:hypothetical protein
MPQSMTGIFRMPFWRTFATGRTRTYVAVFFNKRLRKCDRRKVHTIGRKVPISGSSQYGTVSASPCLTCHF